MAVSHVGIDAGVAARRPLAYFVSDVVDQLDLSAILARYAAEERGYPPYHPAMMVKVLLYAYCIGVASSRKHVTPGGLGG